MGGALSQSMELSSATYERLLQQFERDVLRFEPVEKYADFEAQSVAEGNALLRRIQSPQRHFRPDFTDQLLPLGQAARRVEIGFRSSP